MKTKVKENFKDYSECINFIERNELTKDSKYGALNYIVGYFGYITYNTTDYLSRAYEDGFFNSIF